MGDGWNYTGLKALNSGQKVRFLIRLSKELFRWTRSVTEDYNEFPVGYTEWTLAGHMNIVAARCDCIPYTDYVIKLLKGKRRIPKGIARPDLDVHNKDWKDSWMFELKKEFVSLTTRKDLGSRILARMKEAHDQLHSIVRGSAEKLSDNICSTVAFTVWVDALVKGKDDEAKDHWQKRWVTAKGYYDDWKELWKTFQIALKAVNRQSSSFGRFYYSGYRMPYSLVQEHYQKGVQEVNKGLQREVRIPVAMLWVFAHERWPEIRVS